MKRLLTKEDFENLKPAERISMIFGGEHRGYWYAGQHPVKHCDNKFIVISTGSVTDALVFNYPDELDRREWYVGYDTKIAGERMKAQLLQKVSSIKEIHELE